MVFCIITHVNHYQEQNEFYAYAPYVREMNVWLKYVDKVIVVAPLDKENKSAIDIAYEHKSMGFWRVTDFNITNLRNLFKALLSVPKILVLIYKAMKQADHIHLRCPGNMGLLGCFVQILFPKKRKTAKYAGNWDPKAKQSFTYKLQRWILSNTFLTKNMQVLVYGEWENQTKNVKSFFTATYSEKDKKPVLEFDLLNTIRLLFVGTLSKGKRPLYAVQLAEQLFKKGYDVELTLYGEGVERVVLESYINANGLDSFVRLMGNQNKETVQDAYRQSHFLILPSQSEGWPKVVAEAMFWGCVPVSSRVSCVANMLENGGRGILLKMDLESDVVMVESLIQDGVRYNEKRDRAIAWSRTYTLDYFESEIEKLLKPCE